MDLVAGKFRAGKKCERALNLREFPGGAAPALFGSEHGFGAEKLHAAHGAAALGVFRVGDDVPEKLIAAANPENERSGGSRLFQRGFKSAGAQPHHVRDGAFGAGYHDEVGFPELLRLRGVSDGNAAVLRKNVQVGEVRYPREPDYSDVHKTGGAVFKLC